MQYEIARNSRRCCVSDRELQPGEAFVSALVDAPGGMKRLDYAPEHWPGPPADVIGFWKGRLPADDKPKKPKPLSLEAMVELFDNWEDGEDSDRIRLRYVLTLLLIRRKALKLQDIEQSTDGEHLVVLNPRSNAILRIRDPQLSPEEIEQVEHKLTSLLHAEDDNARTQE